MSALWRPERETRMLPAGDPVEITRAEHVAYGYPAEETSHFWDYWRVIRRRRWTIITCFLVTVTAVTVLSFTARPVYRASATLRIEKDQPRIVKFEEVVKEDSQQDYYQTQYRILQSRSLANRVIGLLQLDQHPEFAAAPKSLNERTEDTVREWLVRWIPVPPPPAPEAVEDLVVTSPLTSAFLGRLTVEPIRSSRLVKVAFDSGHPDLAARAANTVAEAFMAQQLDQKIEATRYATQFLAKQLEEARGKLEESEGKLTKFLNGHDILFVTAEKIAETRHQLRVEIDRAVAALQADYQAAVRTEREIEVALTQQRKLARGLSDSMAEYSLLRREVDTSRELYASLLGRLRET